MGPARWKVAKLLTFNRSQRMSLPHELGEEWNSEVDLTTPRTPRETLLDQQIAVYRDTPLVFGSVADRSLSSTAATAMSWCSPRLGMARIRQDNFRSRGFAAAAERIGISGLVPHDLSDTAASSAISSGTSIKAVQRMLGHASA